MKTKIKIMKKSFLGLIALGFISLSSFTKIDTKEVLMHSCSYNLYSKGKYVGAITIDTPDSVSCDSPEGSEMAIFCWNYGGGC